jgi:hypothetical protein
MNRDHQKNILNISQKWFLINPLSEMRQKNKTEYDEYKWFVPFTYTTKNELNYNFETKPTWLTPNNTECIKFVFTIFISFCSNN